MTLERPWQNNEHDVSCIPEGEYDFELKSDILRKIYIHNVPMRDLIEIHSGNFLKETKGCILAGSNYFYDMDDGIGVSGSMVVMAHLVSLLWQFGIRNGKLIVKGIG